MKKILSFILSVMMLANLVAFQTVASAADESYATSLVNLVTGGDMEGKDANIVSIDPSTSYYPDPAYVEDPDNSSNTVMSVTGVAGNGQPIVTLADYMPVTGHTYALSAKHRGTMNPFLFFNKLWPWVGDPNGTVGVYDITNTAWYDISIKQTIPNNDPSGLMFGYSNTSGNSFMLDDLSVYDVTNAYTIVTTDTITVDPLCYVVVDGAKMTNAGDIVKFKAPAGEVVRIDGEVVEPEADGSYTFEMPAANVSISTSEPSLVNLIEGGDFSDGTVGEFLALYAANLGHEVTVEDGALKFTAAEPLPTWATALTYYPYNLLAGEKYYFTYKAKKGETDATEMFVRAGGNDMFTGTMKANPINADEFTQFGTEYTYSEDSGGISFFMQAIDGIYPHGTYYLDDVELYNITDAITVNFDVLGDAEIVYEDASNGEKVVIDPVNNKVYAEPGAIILFTVADPEEGKGVAVEGAEWTGDGYTYYYEVGAQDATITAGHIAGVRFEEVNYTNKNAVLYSEGSLSCIVVAAAFDGNNNMVKAVPAPVTVTAGSTATIDLSAFDSIEGVKLFVWNNLTDIEPIIEAYTIPAQQ